MSNSELPTTSDFYALESTLPDRGCRLRPRAVVFPSRPHAARRRHPLRTAVPHPATATRCSTRPPPTNSSRRSGRSSSPTTERDDSAPRWQRRGWRARPSRDTVRTSTGGRGLRLPPKALRRGEADAGPPTILPTQITQGTAPGSPTASRVSWCRCSTWRSTARCRSTSNTTCCCGSTRTCRSGCIRSRRASSAAPSAACRCCCSRLSRAARSPSAATRRDTSRRCICSRARDRRPRAPVPRRDRQRPVRLQPDQGLRQHDVRRRLLRRRVLRRRSRGRRLGPRLRQRVREAARAGRDDRHRAGGWVYRDHSVQMSQEVYGFKTGLLGGGGNLVFNRFSGPGPRRPPERLLPPAGPLGGRGRQCAARAAAACSVASSVACSEN